MNLSAPLHGSLAERAHASAHAIRCRPSVGVGVDVEAVRGATKEDAGSLARFLGKRGSGRAEGATVRARSRESLPPCRGTVARVSELPSFGNLAALDAAGDSRCVGHGAMGYRGWTRSPDRDR